MPTSYPGAIDNFPDPSPSDPMTGPSHSGLHGDANDAIHAIETLLGVEGGNVVMTAGDTMTGDLVLSGDPTVALGAAPKQYADLKLALTGGALSGSLELAAGEPSQDQAAVPRIYVLPRPSRYFVDPVNGNDSYEGTLASRAFATIAAALTAATSDQEIHLLPSATPHTIGNLTWKTGARLLGAGLAQSTVRFNTTTGSVFDLTGCSDTEFRDFTVSPLGVQKTAGDFFGLSAAGLQHRFRNLFLNSVYQGFTIAGSAGAVLLEDVSFGFYNTAWGWTYAIGLAGTCTDINIVRGGIGANSGPEFTDGILYLSGTPSTVNVSDWEASNTGATCVNITNGQYIFFRGCEMEAGTAFPAMTVSGGNLMTFRDCHFLGQTGIVQSGSPDRIQYKGGHVLVCQQHGIDIQGGSRTQITGMDILDVSQATTGTYDSIHFAAGVTHFKVANNNFGTSVHGNGNTAKYNLEITAGASDHYVVTGNDWDGYGTAGLSDGGTGTNKAIGLNV